MNAYLGCTKKFALWLAEDYPPDLEFPIYLFERRLDLYNGTLHAPQQSLLSVGMKRELTMLQDKWTLLHFLVELDWDSDSEEE